jgi:ubiquinone/menaquinone biosynthesis C-methylase UbiE
MCGPDGSQESYWNNNLDPANLEAQFDAGSFRLDRELAFFDSPEQRHAMAPLRPVAGRTVLEIGAGISVNAICLLREGARVVATDIAGERLRALRGIVRAGAAPAQARLLVVRCAAEALPFRSDSVDSVYCRGVLVHTRLSHALDEIRRIARPGGWSVFIEPLAHNPFVRVYRATLAPKAWRTIAHYFTRREIAEVRSRFACCEDAPFHFIAFLAYVWQYAVPVVPLFRASVAVLGWVDRMLFRIVPAARRLAWFVVIHVRK